MSSKGKKSANRVVFVCGQCGEDQPRWFGRCPVCDTWNSAAEQSVGKPEATSNQQRGGWLDQVAGLESEPRPLAEVELSAVDRIATGFPEIDRVLGGGLVPGALLLLGGDPGIGKSTLALQMANALCERGRRVLYLSGEESPEQVRLRAQRLGTIPDGLLVFSETDLERSLEAIIRAEPQALIVDSIQTLSSAAVSAGPGSVTQVRECALGILSYAKGRRVPTIMVGHVTKDGAVAGPRVLEHMVDAVLYLEGEQFQQLRLLRAAKNRFGSTQELGVFEMGEAGLTEVTDPSRAFVGESADVPGSVLVAALQGTRPLLVEVQALVTGAGFAVPQRAGSGIPPKRLAVLLAVLEKRVGLRIGNADVFVNVAGGLKLEEPAADLGIAMALAGSREDRPSLGRLVAIGEVGLGGEVRRVNQISARVREANTFGYRPLLVPRAQLEEVSGSEGEVIGVQTVAEALELGLGPRRPRKTQTTAEQDA